MRIKPVHNRMLTRIMRVFFYLLYQPMACSYDLVAWMVSRGRWKTWIYTVLPHIAGSTVLEIGHGPGHLQTALSRKDITTFGVDSSPQMGQLARKRMKNQGYISRLSRSYAQNMPFPNQVFDNIVATFPTEYIYEPESLEEIFRILKPGGKLIVLPFAWITGENLVDRCFAILFKVTGQSPNWDPSWLSPFNEAGFQPEINPVANDTWSLIIITAHKSII